MTTPEPPYDRRWEQRIRIRAKRRGWRLLRADKHEDQPLYLLIKDSQKLTMEQVEERLPPARRTPKG